MPDMSSRNKIRIALYIDPDTFQQIDSFRNPEMSRSMFCTTVIEAALGINEK